MSELRLGIIGYGTISRAMVEVLRQQECRLAGIDVLCRPTRRDETITALTTDAQELARSLAVHTDIASFLAAKPGLVIECAGHEAVRDFAVATLDRGIETVIASIGALADPTLHDRVDAAARNGKTRIILPAGAIGGVDILAALRPAGLDEVVYTSRKPATAWRGTPAAQRFDFDALATATTIFEGNAREAATLYPKNANVAATLALAGVGFEATRVRMVADPTIAHNIHEYSVRGAAADYSIRIEGRPSPGNAKTSMTTVYSLAREVTNRCGHIAI